MLKYFSADWIFPVSSPPLRNGAISVDERGEIVGVFNAEQISELNVTLHKYTGAIVPGFINTHCHLELSHMIGQIPEQTGLAKFVQSVIKNRSAEAEQIEISMQNADQQMFDNGIVAVGDISNQITSKEIKQQSKIYYHTFIEALSFNPERASATMNYANDIKNQFSPLAASVVAHAPYSVSPELFTLINEAAEKDNAFLSIHNQETTDENLFFENKSGGFLDLYKFLGLDISFFEPSGKTSLQTWLPYITKQKILLVHNTVSNEDDITFAKRNHNNLYWCLCPQANLYIENSLPNVDLFIRENLKITLGTDSLASNHQLNILAEMKTLQEQKKVAFEKLLQWSTINGAEFLGLDIQLGTIEPGKKPGLNLIQLSEEFIIQSDQVIKLA
ncbi:cytosine/adenosine deaminase-related metal-dependent hydrolase [Pedobacter psychrotolerans]|uniref:Metal-dependent hydrolase n=1 Tax=Pedobacter psychrotolerans TaxID=1843235 RepID=A0A4R2HDR0_9SPHI|nr:amidohydrolase family protein [Pedobacter psychrotolerans]TCO23941.1 cytosine/adenosine deaminase-related metal-dependent hydrolase [Pedobacter psychrotolerans]GGE63764.1 metal-dependent hydrolase [Pedobacter psychrotolerans]